MGVFLCVCLKANDSVVLSSVVEEGAVMVSVHLNVLGIHSKYQCVCTYVSETSDLKLWALFPSFRRSLHIWYRNGSLSYHFFIQKQEF